MRWPAAGAAALAALALSGCGGGDDGLRVFAAASLRYALPSVDDAPTYVFGGSDELAAQIRQGAEADVFLAASPAAPGALREVGLVDGLRTFASNRLVAIVPRRQRARVRSVRDLDRDGTRLVVGAPGVPVGDYTRAALRALEGDRLLDRVVSEEDDVKGVVSKVALGEADGGFVYATDVAPVAGDVRVVELPPHAQPSIRYVAAIVSDTPRREDAERFLQRLLSRRGRAALADAGFGPP